MARDVASGGYNHREGRSAKPPALRSIEVAEAENGGHTVQHNMSYDGSAPIERPGPHVFGANEGAALIQHLVKHLNIKNTKPIQSEGKEREEY